MLKGPFFLILLLAVQAGCALFFVSDILSSFLGLRTKAVSWQTREFMEIGAAIGLVLGLVLGAVALYRTIGQRNLAEKQRMLAEERLRRASSDFMSILEENFSAWGLTAAERDVALFAIKGMSTPEIALLRHTSEGTVKAQTNAIYRKAGVTGRPQLLSLFIESLMRSDGPVARPAAPQSAA